MANKKGIFKFNIADIIKKVLIKLTTVVLVFLFALQPIAPVFASNLQSSANSIISSMQSEQAARIAAQNAVIIAEAQAKAQTQTSTTTTYAYDANGQRIKMTVVDQDKGINTTTYYISKYYEETRDNNNPSAPPKIVKHIFANEIEVQTVFGTGKDAKVYNTLTDSLGNVTGLVDSTGKLVETTDYYPFGAIRIDQKTDPTVPSNPNKFLDQKYDEQTGLNYLNARYYNSSIDRFLSEDPTARDNPEKFLADPQQLNYYSYARNNPITMSDPSGESAELGIKSLNPIPGAHGTIIINAEPGANLSQYGDGNRFSIGGYPSNNNFFTNRLQVQINNLGDLNYPVEKYLSVTPLEVPKGMTPAQYDQKLLESASNLEKRDLGPYFFSGQPLSGHANSGNVFTQTIIDAGGSIPQIQDVYYGPGILGKNTPYFPLGSGNPVGTPSYGQQAVTAVKNTITSAVLKVTSTIDSIKSTLSSSVYSPFNKIRSK